MDNILKNFVETHNKVVHFSIDTTDHNEDTSDFKINPREFLKYLYIPRTAVDKLKKEIIKSSDRLLCIAGPRGSGKTSIAHKTIEYLINNNNFVFYYNVRRDNQIKWIKSEEEAFKYFYNKILYEYKNVFSSKPQKKENNPELDLFEYIFSENDKPRELFSDLIDETNDFDEYKYINEKDTLSSITEFISNNYRDKELVQILRNVRKKLTVTQYSFIVNKVKGYQRQVIWIDNIDKLDNSQQRLLLNALTEIKRGIVDNIVLIIAVREENIFRPEHFEPFAAPLISTIYWEDPDKYSGQSYQAFNMPVLSNDKIEDLINQRLNYAKKIMPSFFNGKVINNNIFDKIKSLSDKIVEIFIEEKMYFFSNNSIRNLLALHHNFLKFLLKGENGDYSTEISYNKEGVWFLKTLLFYYIATNKEYVAFTKYIEANDITRQNKLSCFLPQLTLTTTWNYCITSNKKSSNFTYLPTVSNIIEILNKIGYKEDDIKQSIFHLYHTEMGTTNYIAIETENKINSPKEIKDDYKIKVTYKGKSMLNNVSFSFGYFFSIMRNNNTNNLRNLNSTEFAQYWNFVLTKLELLTKLHLKSLLLLKNKYYSDEKEKWFTKYLISYGIPINEGYAKSFDKFGKKIMEHSPFKHAIYLEGLYASLNGFRKQTDDIHIAFNNLYEKFNTVFNDIISNKIKDEKIINDTFN